MKWCDRVKETSTTTGTGNFTLAGAVTDYVTFASVFASTDTNVAYVIQNTGAGQWEVGLGNVNGTTLTRTTVIVSTNSNALVNFSAGSKYVFSTPAGKFLADMNFAIAFVGGLCAR